ncbi:MAG: hypothetical protein NZ699_05085 [Roseiflexus sp.]|nr:hypothetical protein [Roseiflexus sp.]
MPLPQASCSAIALRRCPHAIERGIQPGKRRSIGGSRNANFHGMLIVSFFSLLHYTRCSPCASLFLALAPPVSLPPGDYTTRE